MPETTRRTARLVVRQGRRRDRAADRPGRRARPCTVRSTGRPGRRRPRPRDIDWGAHHRREPRTTSPSTARCARSGWSATRAPRRPCRATSWSPSTSRGRWPSRWCSPRSSARCSPRSGPLRTSLVVFDTEVVDLTPHLDDPVDVLFGCQLGGGTDINRGVAYAASLVRAAGEHPARARHRPLRGRRRRAAAAPRGRAGARPASRSSCCSRSATPAHRRTTTSTPPRWRRSACPPSPARRTRSPTCSRSRCARGDIPAWVAQQQAARAT